MDSGAFQTDYIPNVYEMDVIYWITSKNYNMKWKIIRN